MVQHKRNALKDKKINVKRWPRKIPNLWLWQIKQLLYFNWHTYSSLRLDGWMRSCYLLNTQHTNLQFSLSKSETYTYSTYGNTRAHTHSHTHTHTHTHTQQMKNKWEERCTATPCTTFVFISQTNSFCVLRWGWYSINTITVVWIVVGFHLNSTCLAS